MEVPDFTAWLETNLARTNQVLAEKKFEIVGRSSSFEPFDLDELIIVHRPTGKRINVTITEA